MLHGMNSGLATSGKPFLRTPKLESTAPVRSVLAVSWEEILLLTALIASMIATWQVRGGWSDMAGVVWMAMLVIQSLPYAATLAMAIISILPPTAPRPVPTFAPEPDPRSEIEPEFKQAA